MMAEHLEPEELTTAGLPAARRGYDRKAVATLLENAARRWRELRDHHLAVVEEIERRGGIENLGRDLREIGERVATILSEAQQAAEEMRSRAIEEAGDRLEVAEEQAAATAATAGADAYRVRKDAWEAGTGLLEQVQDTIDALIEQAEADTLIIRARAEQEAHRHLADARKEAADLTRSARYEAERLVGEAKRRADELLAGAAQAEASRPVLRSSEWGVTVLESEGLRRGGDPAVEIDPHHPAYGDVLAAEVSSLRARSEAVPSPPPFPPPEDAEEPVVRIVPEPPPAPEPEIEVAVDAEPDADSEPEPAPEPAPEPEPEPAPDEVGGLFERLRRTDEIPVVVVDDRPDPEPDPESVAVPDSEPVAVPEPERESARPPVPRVDSVAIRERLLLPLINERVREVRRVLMEAQNQVLDEIRTLRKGSAWHPDPEALGPAVSAAAAPLPEQAVGAGGRGAAEMGAGPAAEESDPGRAAGYLDDMVAALEGALEAAAAADDPGTAVGGVFRTWRNDEAERWLRTAAFAGYHDGLMAGLAAHGVSEVVGVRHGRLCKECPAGAPIVWDPASPPPGHAVPPAHLDCSCAVEPHV